MDPEFAKVLPQVVTGAFTVAGGLGVAVMNQVTQARQRKRERAAAADAKEQELVRELFDATADLQLVLIQVTPLWNSWQPKLMMLFSAALELGAARAAGIERGMAEVGRVATRHGDQEMALVPAVAAAVRRVLEAATRAALLPESSVRVAALDLAEAAAELNAAYSKSNLWKPRRARTARSKAEHALNEARAALIKAGGPVAPLDRGRWWHGARPWRKSGRPPKKLPS